MSTILSDSFLSSWLCIVSSDLIQLHIEIKDNQWSHFKILHFLFRTFNRYYCYLFGGEPVFQWFLWGTLLIPSTIWVTFLFVVSYIIFVRTFAIKQVMLTSASHRILVESDNGSRHKLIMIEALLCKPPPTHDLSRPLGFYGVYCEKPF